MNDMYQVDLNTTFNWESYGKRKPKNYSDFEEDWPYATPTLVSVPNNWNEMPEVKCVASLITIKIFDIKITNT